MNAEPESQNTAAVSVLESTMSGPRLPFPRRKPSIEQYPQHNRAERRHAAKVVRRKQAKVG